MPRTNTEQLNQTTEKENSSLHIERKIDGLFIITGILLFRVTGLTIEDLKRLKVTLRVSLVSNQNNYFCDHLDLNRAEERDSFADRAFSETGIKSSVVKTEMKRLIDTLDIERVRLLENRDPDSASELSDQEKAEAIEFLSQKDLLTCITSDLHKMGIVGEEENSLLLYLAMTSRLLPVPVSALLISRKPSGESNIRNIVTELMPPESVRQYTYITNKALLHEARNLHRKTLVIDQTEGLRECLPFVQSIISNQNISTLTTNPESALTKQPVKGISKQACVSVIVSTCQAHALDQDFRRLFLQITLDETPEQTRRIIEEQLRNECIQIKELQKEREQITRIHRNAQRFLRQLPVLFPNNLNINYPANCLENRRDMILFISLVKTITLLNQYRREIKDGVIIAEREDFETAIQLSKRSFSLSEDELSPQARKVLSIAKVFVNQKFETIHNNDPKINLSDIPFTRRDIREVYGCSESYLRPYFKELERKEYFGKVKGGHGLQFQYVLLEQSEDFAQLRSNFALQATS